ncbi:hypothetical protein QE429_000866 [Bacillus sp. SORGH_AS 510]|uniref:hypothetical protein n=1 Tax=Bacillus sp. SORGH_AS_0510 TaxID=3041771 RepID=UPI0027892231|nr:hypothetical protein [Bacillus sp. SORGH_AS_0510]MDQ1144039.1 hypothetical protein [Bacillus sp. SORGH_AS_0510]
MIAKISKALRDGDFTYEVYLSLDGIEINGDELILTIQVTYEDDDQVLQLWRVTCKDFKSHSLSVQFFQDFDVLDEHVFLWEFNKNSGNLFIKGHSNNINQVIGELFYAHSNAVSGQLPLEKYLNINYYTKDIVGLLTHGEGLFSKGPVNIIKVHEKVLSEYGYETSLIELPTKENTTYKIFVFGESFVVAKDFEALQVL